MPAAASATSRAPPALLCRLAGAPRSTTSTTTSRSDPVHADPVHAAPLPSPTQPFGPGPPSPAVRERGLSGAKRVRVAPKGWAFGAYEVLMDRTTTPPFRA